MLDEMGNQGVTQLMERDQLALLFGEHLRPTLEPGHHAIDRLFELGHPDHVLAVARRQQSAFIDHVSQLSSRESRGPARQDLEVNTRLERHIACMDLEDLLAALHLGQIHLDLAIEASRPKERRVEHLRPVRRGHDDHTCVGLESVHLGEKLLQRLLLLGVRAHLETARYATVLSRRSRR